MVYLFFDFNLVDLYNEIQIKLLFLSEIIVSFYQLQNLLDVVLYIIYIIYLKIIVLIQNSGQFIIKYHYFVFLENYNLLIFDVCLLENPTKLRP